MIKSSLPPDTEISTSSMADIAFQILIFFMVAATFTATRGLDMALPEEEAATEIEPVDSIHLVVQANGDLIVDRKVVPLSRLLGHLGPKLAANASKPVILETEAAASYGSMLAVFDVLRQGKERLGLDRDIVIAIPTAREREQLW